MDGVMWVAKRDVLTPCGWVAKGRVVADGDPMLVGCEDAFERFHMTPSPAVLDEPATVETAGGGAAADRSGKRTRR